MIPGDDRPKFEGPRSFVNARPEKRKSNGIGLAGFLISFIGILTCGFGSVISLVLCTVALQKEPRGLAVTGFVFSLFGIVLLMVFISFQVTGMMFASQMMGGTFNRFLSTMDYQVLQNASSQIATKWETDGVVPDAVLGQKILAGEMDQWGKQIVYETDGESFSVISFGPDAKQGTADDLKIGPFLAHEEVDRSWNSLGNVMPGIVVPPGGATTTEEEDPLDEEDDKDDVGDEVDDANEFEEILEDLEGASDLLGDG